MAIRVMALTAEQKKKLTKGFARRAIRDLGHEEIDVRELAGAISTTLRYHGYLNARIDPDEFARVCAEARGEQP